ncbi:MAG: transglutaminase domain-containing protein [Oscillospiraceae bacterium]
MIHHQCSAVLASLFVLLTALPAAHAQAAGHEYFYAQLNASEKELYRQIDGWQSDQVVTARADLSASPMLLGGGSWERELYISLRRAFDAYQYDHPEAFWLYRVNSENHNIATLNSGGVSVKGFSLEFINSDSNLISEKYACEKALNSLMDRVNTSGSRYEQLRSLYDNVLDWMTFDDLVGSNFENRRGKRSQHITSALLDRSTVCAGYAKVFKLGCDRLNIPCVLVSGTGIGPGGTVPHMWVVVQLEDGKWYAADPTWDDNDSGDYFLVGNNTVVMNGLTFEQTHMPDSGPFNASGYGFTYPGIAGSRYNQ